MHKLKSVLLPVVGLLLALFSLTAGADWQVNLKPGVTPVSKDIYELHQIVLWVVYGIAIVVFGLILWSIVFHRKSRGVTPATWHESMTVEILWTIIPFVILIGMAVPATQALIKMEDTTSDVDLTIKATGYQWMWSYEYMDEGINFYSKLAEESNKIRQPYSGLDPFEHPNYLYDVDREVVIPVGKKVRLLTTAVDVIHAWWVPALGGKKDAIPGFINEMWILAEEEGVYRGSCAELCGKDHAFMPIVVRVVSEEEYKQWVAEQKGESATAAAESSTVVAQAQ